MFSAANVRYWPKADLHETGPSAQRIAQSFEAYFVWPLFLFTSRSRVCLGTCVASQ